MADLESTFNQFAAHGKTGDKSQIKGMDNKNWSKLCKDCKIMDGKIIQGNDVDIVFSKVKSKGARVITFDQFLIALKELADKKYKKKESDERARTELIYDLVRGGSVQNTGVTKTSKTGGVAKMTDTSQYTGSHKERFDASGKGKGITGREDLAENSGYVGNYKGAGTYDDKVSK